jgi:hypothetical protein
MPIREDQRKRILLIAGTGRNSGKTTLASSLTKHFSESCDIIGLKITSIYPDENEFHGEKTSSLNADFEIFDDTENESEKKDTFRMKQAGAKKVFFVRTKDEFIADAVDELFKIIGENQLIVCESASLRNLLKPGIFIMIRSSDESKIKERARKLFPLADMLLVSENLDFEKIAASIHLDQKGWHLKAE